MDTSGNAVALADGGTWEMPEGLSEGAPYRESISLAPGGGNTQRIFPFCLCET
jgi:hypothetical protein